jgi:hypothetical protein
VCVYATTATPTTEKQPNPWYFIQIMKISMKNGNMKAGGDDNGGRGGS